MPSRHSRANHVARFVIRGLKARLRDERAELRAILDHVSPEDTVCDVGANKGAFTFWLARWAKRVVAFEPQADIADTLAADCRSLRFSNVSVERVGVYSRSGMQTLYIPDGHSPGASIGDPKLELGKFTAITIPVVSLDDYFSDRERISVLKIDVEGAEREVLKGAERILRTHSPLLVIECEGRHARASAPQDVFRFLESFGYDGHFAYRQQVLPISAFDSSVHQRTDGEWFWKSTDYCNNFIFHRS
jgi:FkbM family methyltransferase